MKRVLILDESSLPNNLRKHTFVSKKGTIQELNTLNERLELLERKIIDSFNKFNPKLNITKVIYEKITRFTGYNNAGMYFGLISDLVIVDNIEKNSVDLFKIDDKTYKLKVFGNVFVSYMDERTRDAFFTQIVFPELIHIIDKIKESQTFLFSDKPLYFINLVEEIITARSIHEEAMIMKMSGFNFINVFDSGLESIPYINNYKDFMGYMQRKKSKDIIEFDHVENKVILLTKPLYDSIKKNHNGDYRFIGSGEKFYWLTALCTLKIAFDFGVHLDITQTKDFNITYNKEIGNSSKFTRTAILFNYLNKLSKGKRYYNV